MKKKKSCFRETNGVKRFTRVTSHELFLREMVTEGGRAHWKQGQSTLVLTAPPGARLRMSDSAFDHAFPWDLSLFFREMKHTSEE